MCHACARVRTHTIINKKERRIRFSRSEQVAHNQKVPGKCVERRGSNEEVKKGGLCLESELESDIR